jgi:hypothetical protein
VEYLEMAAHVCETIREELIHKPLLKNGLSIVEKLIDRRNNSIEVM